MKELIVNAVSLGYTPLFYTKRGTINAMAKKLEKLTVERCEPLELSRLQQWLREGKGVYLDIGSDWTNERKPKFVYSFSKTSGEKKFWWSDLYLTYEEALLDGLKEAVNLAEN